MAKRFPAVIGLAPILIETEALRLARRIIKYEIKQSGAKVSSFLAKDISKAARLMIADPSSKGILARAKVNLKREEAWIASYKPK